MTKPRGMTRYDKLKRLIVEENGNGAPNFPPYPPGAEGRAESDENYERSRLPPGTPRAPLGGGTPAQQRARERAMQMLAEELRRNRSRR